jgi:type IV pilus assembly protein PilE
MNKQLSKRNSGFTMIELMIVLVVVAVLVALAYPSYASYVRKAKRGEAMQFWRSNNTAYADTDDIPAPTHDNYDFSITAGPSASAYTLQAEAKGGDDQENDATKAGDSCATLSIDQNGTKGPEAACWD